MSINSSIGILGTGSVGTSLGNLIRHSGCEVIWGARVVKKSAALLGGAELVPFAELAAKCDTIIVAVPWLSAIDLLASLPSLDGKIIVDATNPLQADWSPVLLGQESSAGEEIQKAFPKARVVKAFNTIFADMMGVERTAEAASPVSGFYCGNDPEARASIGELIKRIGFAPVDCGALHCARYLEAMAHLNIHITVAMQGGTRALFSYGQA